jgi:hypothetical protein
MVARPTVPVDSVTVYRTAQQVPRRFVEIAMLTPSDNPLTNRYAMRSLLQKAGSMGANGVILMPPTGSNSDPQAVAIVVER